MEENYSKLADYYDKIMPNPEGKVKLINSWIKEYKKDSKSILEIACGTGEILKLLENKYNVSGLDLSREMLKIAEKKLKKCNLHHQNMTSFSLNQKFDVILCVFDSINHLLKFSEWKQVFKNASNHLHKDGLFIFDINTLLKFERFAKLETSYVENVGKDIIIGKISKIGRNKIEFYMGIFEHQKKDKYKLYEEKIVENSFEIDKIKKELEKYFNILEIYDTDEKIEEKKGQRMYFICKLK